MAKRGNGEGSIGPYKGGYVARLTLPNGKRKAYYAPTRAEAAAKLAAGIKARDGGGLAADDRLTVGAYLAHWLDHDAAHTVRPSTLRGYRQHVTQHIAPAIGRIRLRDLTARHVQGMLGDLHRGGMHPATVQRVRSTLRRALGRAVKLGTVARNVAADVEVPRATRQQVAAMTPDDCRAILAAFKGHALEAAVTVALMTGIRQGELRALRWQDVDLDAGELRVRHALAQDATGSWVLAEPKTAASRRTLAIKAETVAALRRQRARQREDRLLAGGRWQDGGYVFTSSVGTPISQAALLVPFKAQLEAAGLPVIRWHDCRHGAASMLMAGGMSVVDVAAYLGHASPTTTLNVYAHAAPAGQVAAAQLLDDVAKGRA